MRYAQLVIGPAGSAKTRYCSVVLKHGVNSGRSISVINLDPAAVHIEPMADIMELIQTEEASANAGLGGLISCMKTLIDNPGWLQEKLGEGDDDYFLIDCPWQLELYSFFGIMRQVVSMLKGWNLELDGIFLVDSHTMINGTELLSGTMSAIGVMTTLELPQIKILCRSDRFHEPDPETFIEDATKQTNDFREQHGDFADAISRLVDEFSLIKLYPMNITGGEGITDILIIADNIIEYMTPNYVKIKDYRHERPV